VAGLRKSQSTGVRVQFGLERVVTIEMTIVGTVGKRGADTVHLGRRITNTGKGGAWIAGKTSAGGRQSGGQCLI